MNRQDAKTILEMYRAGGQDAADPQFAEALALARRDAELGAWFERQQAFDATLSASLKSVPVPKGLPAALLALSVNRAAPAPSLGKRLANAIHRFLQTSILPDERILTAAVWRSWPARLGVFALVLGLVAVPVLLQGGKSKTVAEHLADIVGASWDIHRHVEFQTQDLAAVRKWLAAQGCDYRFMVPPGLAQQGVLHGARVLNWQGSKIAFLCYLRGAQHLHYLVADLAVLAETTTPDQLLMADCNGWTTFSWTQGNKVHVLTGLRMQEFIRRFRKGGRWLWDGRESVGWSEHAHLETSETVGAAGPLRTLVPWETLQLCWRTPKV